MWEVLFIKYDRTQYTKINQEIKPRRNGQDAGHMVGQ